MSGLHRIDEEELGKILQRIRERRGRTLDEMSEASGVSRATIHRWEKGVFPAGIGQLLSLVWSGGSTLSAVEDELLGRAEEPGGADFVRLRAELLERVAEARELDPSAEGEILFGLLTTLADELRTWAARVGGPEDLDGVLRELGADRR